MAGPSVSIVDSLTLGMSNISAGQSDESRLWSSQSIVPAIFALGWWLSTWQSIVLLLVSLVVHDQGNHHRPRGWTLTDHIIQCYTSNVRAQSPVLRSRSRSWAPSFKHSIRSSTLTSSSGQVDLSAVSLSSTSMFSIHRLLSHDSRAYNHTIGSLFSHPTET
jgi:hypothetical protein